MLKVNETFELFSINCKIMVQQGFLDEEKDLSGYTKTTTKYFSLCPRSGNLCKYKFCPRIAPEVETHEI